MKALCGGMVLANLSNLIGAIRVFGWKVPTALKVLVGLDLVCAGAVVFFLFKWLLNDNKSGRGSLVWGLFLNIFQ